MKATTTAPLLLLTTLAALLPASGGAAAGVEGTPAKDPRISLSVRDRPAGEVVSTIADRAGWSLTASGDRLQKKVSVRIKARPASEILATVVEVAGLQARFESRGDAPATLVVQDPPAGEPAAAAAGDAGDADDAILEPMAPGVDEVVVAPNTSPDESPKKPRRKRGGVADRTAVGEDLVIAAGETVGNAVATGGSVTVFGHVTGDATAVGGSLTLEPSARVDGDAVAVGGTLEVKPGATVGGERTSVGGSLGKLLSSAIKVSAKGGDHGSKRSGGGGSWFGRLWWTFPFFVLGFLIMLFVPERLLTLRQALSDRPWASTAAGVGSWFGLIALCVLLAVTIIGILLIPVAILLFVGLGLFGLTALAWWTGSKLSFIPGSERPLIAFILGTAVFAIISLIPYLGAPALMLATTVSAGATLLLLLSNLRRRRPHDDDGTGTPAMAG